MQTEFEKLLSEEHIDGTVRSQGDPAEQCSAVQTLVQRKLASIFDTWPDLAVCNEMSHLPS